MAMSENRLHARPAAGGVEIMRVWLLGGFRVSVGSRVIEGAGWRSRKAAGVIKLLALAPEHRMHRERVMDLLWPDLDPKSASNNLHYVLHIARRTLDEKPGASARYLRLRDDHLELCPESPLWIDVEVFEEAASAARRSTEPAAYRAALDLYAGDLLPGERYESWVEGRREELRRSRLSLLVELARLYEGRGEGERATEVLERVVADEPVHEEAHAGLMRLYAITGQHFRAVFQYERLRKALRRELDREPDAASRRLYRQIMAGQLPASRPDVPGFVPTGGAGTTRHNLPLALSSFIGRERELVEIKRHLTMTRLLTLTGTGGAGKTRLAIEVAGGLAATFPGGAWLVELAPLPDPELVPRAVAAALGLREEPGRPLVSTLLDDLRSRNLMLILDNCEHLIEATARLAEALLSSCPGLRVLATSREPLGVTGEVCWPVRPLSVPAADHRHAVESLAGYESVRLFVERTRSRLPGFELTGANSRSVAEVCRKLEGIPLAIELATARMAVLAVEQVADRLDDSLGLLTGGVRTADPRHQTLRAALDWSYEPLSGTERALFRRLSVFAGGWTFEAAEAVGAGDGIEDGVLDLLGRLVSKSLVTVQAGRPGAVRYGMLEPVRQYAHEKLEQSGEAEEAHRRHAAFFLALAEGAEPELLGPHPVPGLERLAEEHDNFRAALSWALDAPGAEDRVELGLRIAVALARFWGVHGVGEGRGWLEKGLSRNGAPAPVRAKALNEAGWLSLFQGDQDMAVEMLEESRSLFEALGDRRGAATALANLGFAVAHRCESGRLAVLREKAGELLGEPLDPRTRAHLLNFLALAALEAGDDEQAISLAGTGLELYRRLEDAQGIAISLAALGMAALKAGDPARASGYFEEVLRMLRRMGDKMGIAYCLLGLGGVAGEQARPDRAARLWGAAESLREAIGMGLSPFDRSQTRYEERLSAAYSLMDEESWEAAWSEGRAMSPEEAIEYALSEEEAVPAPAAKGSEILTPREREVAALVARGLTNRQIATELSISERTVHTHLRRILRKLGLGSRAQITAWVIETRPPQDHA